MYENKTPINEIIAGVLIFIFAFFVLPWLFSLGDTPSSQERNRFDDSSIYYP